MNKGNLATLFFVLPEAAWVFKLKFHHVPFVSGKRLASSQYSMRGILQVYSLIFRVSSSRILQNSSTPLLIPHSSPVRSAPWRLCTRAALAEALGWGRGRSQKHPSPMPLDTRGLQCFLPRPGAPKADIVSFRERMKGGGECHAYGYGHHFQSSWCWS